MARGGVRPGAGRKSKGNHLNPRAIEEIKQKINGHHIIQRLTKHIGGEVEMAASAVTAALGLLRKVIPDLAAVNHTGQIELTRAIELPDNELAGIATTSRNGASETQDDTPVVH